MAPQAASAAATTPARSPARGTVGERWAHNAAAESTPGGPGSAKKTGGSPAQNTPVGAESGAVAGRAGPVAAARGEGSTKSPEPLGLRTAEASAEAESPKLPAEDPRNELSDTDTCPSYDEAAAVSEEGSFEDDVAQEPKVADEQQEKPEQEEV